MKKINFAIVILTISLCSQTALAIKLGNLTSKIPNANIGSVSSGTKADKKVIQQELQDWIARPNKEFIEFYTKKYGSPVVIDGNALDCWGFVNTDGKAFRIINYSNDSHSAPSLQDYPCKKQGS